MNIIIRNTDEAPIYEQLQSQLRAAILQGEFQEGDALPSIRALAKDLKISVITTKRAYEELEGEGFIVTVPGKGCYVTRQSAALIRERSIKELEEHLSKASALARTLGLSDREVFEHYQILSGMENEP